MKRWIIIDLILIAVLIAALIFIKHYIEEIPQGVSCAELSYMGEMPIERCK